ncbi:hypothetical protein RJ55_04724 [Drechmeria coniospora]|nr:hypothetical protein RJ55_04724 [Drechmeria coniospora]
MRVNEKTAISTSNVLLVPYEAHHVPTYHNWMQDPSIQEATASEPMTLEEEFENQQSWRTARDKLTFILCEPLDSVPERAFVRRRVVDADDKMRGDVNFFLYPDEDEEAEAAQDRAQESKQGLVGEVDVMVAESAHRGRGFGNGAVRALLTYLQDHLEEMMTEYAQQDGAMKGRKVELRGLMAKIQEANAGSRALFRNLGFTQKGEVNYFGEVTVVMSWEDLTKRVREWKEAADGYRELVYSSE